MPSPSDDPIFWRGRAAEARVAARQMNDTLARSAMLALAARYERLANRITRGEDILSGAGKREEKSRGLEL
jgi:hypothetical protein